MRHFDCKLAVAAGIAALYGCSDPTTYNFENSVNQDQQTVAANAAAAPPQAIFDPASANLPFPNNLLFAGSEDGTLNIPLEEGVSPDDLSDTRVSLNKLDGFSTTAPVTMQVSSAVDENTVILGESVRIFEVQADAASFAVTGVTAELDQSQAAVALQGNRIAVVPVQPLKESTHYLVVATNAITDANGAALAPSSSFVLSSGSIELTGPAAALEPVRQLTNAMLGAAATQGVDPGSVVTAWTFKTQSITPVMQQLKFAASPQAMTVVPTNQTTSDVNPALQGIADIYIGTLDIPYYRTAPANANDVNGITSYWQGVQGSNLTAFNPTPIATSVQTIPVLMSVPNAASGNSAPAGGWPIAIFVHGVTSNRLAMLAIADSMALAGVAVIAIDQPMHGITDATNPFAAVNTPFADTERTFAIDLINNDTGAPGPDGVTDPSGRHFFSPQFLLATRDNLRQSVADLLILSESLVNINTVPINPARKTAIGHSLGGSTLTPFLALDDSVVAASLGMPAAGLAVTVLTSDSFGPPIIAGLAASGVVEGTDEYEQFKVVAQTAVDSGDAINFATMAAQNMPIHMIEVVGDTTVKNNNRGSPLSGTDSMARLMGLAATSQDTSESALVRFSAGNHSSLLSPEASLAATIEMQTQVATFAASAGGLIKITNPEVIEAQ